MRAHRWLGPLVVVALAPACAQEPDAPDPKPPGTGGGGGGGGGIGGDDGSGATGGGTGSGSGTLGGCDPYADPADECGAGQECSLGDGTCQPSTGSGMAGETCTVSDWALLLDTCAPALVCTFDEAQAGRCMQLCDPASPDCGGTASCVEVGPAATHVCVPPCSLTTQDCPLALTDACYVVEDVAGQLTSGCRPEGAAAAGAPCMEHEDCARGLACTPAAQHTSGCGGSPSCCALVCDLDAPECFDTEATCVPLGIAADPGAGYCGVG